MDYLGKLETANLIEHTSFTRLFFSLTWNDLVEIKQKQLLWNMSRYSQLPNKDTSKGQRDGVKMDAMRFKSRLFSSVKKKNAVVVSRRALASIS